MISSDSRALSRLHPYVQGIQAVMPGGNVKELAAKRK
jgi:hypothetical protein